MEESQAAHQTWFLHKGTSMRSFDVGSWIIHLCLYFFILLQDQLVLVLSLTTIIDFEKAYTGKYNRYRSSQSTLGGRDHSTIPFHSIPPFHSTIPFHRSIPLNVCIEAVYLGKNDAENFAKLTRACRQTVAGLLLVFVDCGAGIRRATYLFLDCTKNWSITSFII